MWEKKTAVNVEVTYAWLDIWQYLYGGTTSGDTAATDGLQGYAGHSDWRIPSNIELQSILLQPCTPACIDPVFGPTSPNRYWTSTTDLRGNPAGIGAFVVDFGTAGVQGGTNKTIGAERVRAVRGGS